MQREPHFQHFPVFEQPFHGGRIAQLVEPEQETVVMCRDLQQRNLVLPAFREARTGLGVYS